MKIGFALNHDKSLQIYFFCHQAKNDFLKDVESTVGGGEPGVLPLHTLLFGLQISDGPMSHLA